VDEKTEEIVDGVLVGRKDLLRLKWRCRNASLYKKRYEPPRRRLRIKNKIRLTVVPYAYSISISRYYYTTSRGQVKSVTSLIEWPYGDTYWGIAKQLQEQRLQI